MIGCKLTNDLQSAARQAALREAAEFEIHLVEGEEIDAIVRFLADYKADLLGIGLHHHPVAHITSLEHGLLTCTGCSLQRSWCPLNSGREKSLLARAAWMQWVSETQSEFK